MIRGDFQANVELDETDRLGQLLNVLGAMSGADVVLGGGVGTIIAGAWSTGNLTATHAGRVMIRGDMGANMRLSGQDGSGKSLGVFSVQGEMAGATVRARGGIGSAVVGSMRNSGLYVCVLDGVAGMPETGTPAEEYFAVQLAGMQTPAIRTMMISRPGGAFENSVVAAPSMGTVILRGVATGNDLRPFGLVADSKINVLTRHRAGAPASSKRNLEAGLVEVLPAEGDFQVRVLQDWSWPALQRPFGLARPHGQPLRTRHFPSIRA